MNDSAESGKVEELKTENMIVAATELKAENEEQEEMVFNFNDGDAVTEEKRRHEDFSKFFRRYTSF